MPFDEVFIWQRYREKHGLLDPGRKIDHAAALLAFMQGKTAAKGATPADFLPKPSVGKEEQSEEQILAMFEMMARKRG